MSDVAPDRLIGMKAICMFLGVSEDTALKWQREFDLPIKKTSKGGYWVGSRHTLDAWFREFSAE